MFSDSLHMIVSGLTFSKTKIGKIGHTEKYTIPAAVLLAISVLLDTVIAYFNGNSGNSGLARSGLDGAGAAIGQLGSGLIGLFLSALIMVYVLRIFKAQSSYAGVLRVYGAAVIWMILMSLVGLVTPESLMIVGVLFWLAYNFAVLFGLAGYTGLALWKSFIAIVLTFIAVFIVMIPYGMVITAIF
jgi:hypothetical protein